MLTQAIKINKTENLATATEAPNAFIGLPNDTARLQPSICPTLLRLPAVKRAVGFSGPHIYRMIASGAFPRPIKLGKGATGAVAWIEGEVLAWLTSKIAERDECAAK